MKRIPLVLAGLVAGSLLTLLVASSGPDVHAQRAPGGCAQWETEFAGEAPATVRPAPQVGQIQAEPAPAGGWEPFAYAPGGQLAFKRCLR